MTNYIEILRKVVTDWKTTSGPLWALTEHTMRADVQVQSYALGSAPPNEEVKTRWVYFPTKSNRQPWAVETIWTPAERAELVSVLRPKVQAVADMYKQRPTPGDVPGNYEHCKAYGGCPFISNCAKFREAAVQETKTKVQLLLEAKRAKAAGLAAGTPAKAEEQAKVETPAINPPESANVPETADVADLPEEPKRGKGRPKGAKNKPKVEEVAEAEQEAVGPEIKSCFPAGTKQAAEFDEALGRGGSFTLYVNCFPVKGADEPVMLLSDIIGVASHNVEESLQIPHWSLADYGAGAGALATEFASCMPSSGSVVLNKFSPEGKALQSLLEKAAARVVYGT